MVATMLFFCNDTATTEIYTLSLRDALPIYSRGHPAERHFTRAAAAEMEDDGGNVVRGVLDPSGAVSGRVKAKGAIRSEEHTSELQSRQYLVCRLLLEKKKTNKLDREMVSED